MKVTRNSPCPCGSGIKYKKCCGARALRPPVFAPSQETTTHQRKHVEQATADWQAYGHVRPLISAPFQGQRLIAVGDQILSSDEWKTFPDFLFDYVKMIMGKGWGKAELAKPEADRHLIVQWYQHVCKYQSLQQRDADGIFAVSPDGVMTAYYMLAYDLYVLRHHQRLHDKVVHRLKIPDQFQGARHELFVAATLIRAGCHLEFHDEADSTTTHPELTASHRRTGATFDVEAKSRHRPGILGRPGEKQDLEVLKTGLHRLLNRGSRKAATHPLIVFIDLNLPPEYADVRSDQWADQLRLEVGRFAVKEKGVWPFVLAVITSYPHHYGEFGECDPLRWNYIVQPDGIDCPHQRKVACDIERALRQYGNIPNFFPGG